MCHEIFAVLIFAIFEVFPAIRKNKEIVSVQSQLVSFIQKQRNTGLLFENVYFCSLLAEKQGSISVALAK